MERLANVEEPDRRKIHTSPRRDSSFSLLTMKDRQGPVTEECLFRSAAIPLLLMAGCSTWRIIFHSPLIFGLAHIHHFYEFRITSPRTPLSAAVARSVLQFAYTTIFGAYATFLFLRTGSLLVVIVAHALCNAMGLPRLWGVLEPHWAIREGTIRRQVQIRHTVVYYILLVGGSLTWWHNLFTLTESSSALTRME